MRPLKLENFRDIFDAQIMLRGIKYYHEKRIESVTLEGKNVFWFKIRGSFGNRYEVEVVLDNSLEIMNLYCDCMHACDGNKCKHMFAALMYIDQNKNKLLKEYASKEVLRLIESYSTTNFAPAAKAIRILPELSFYYNTLFMMLKIGEDKLYRVNDITKLETAFKNRETLKYGKNFELTHDYGRLDENSRKLLELAVDAYYSKENSLKFKPDKKNFILRDGYLVRFLELNGDNPLKIGGENYDILRKNPRPLISLKSENGGGTRLKVERLPLFLGKSGNGCFLSEEENKLYIADSGFTSVIEPMCRWAAEYSDGLSVSNQDIPRLYNTVIKRLDDFCEIQMDDRAEELIPPQMLAELYIDTDDSDDLRARLGFIYNDTYYPAFYNQSANAYCDVDGEARVMNSVARYFDVDKSDGLYPFRIKDDNAIFELVNSGMSELSNEMELYLSDKFKNVRVRRQTGPNIGVKTSGNMLSLDISAAGYTTAELAELLKAYRQGRKFYRFKDGSFSIIDDSVEELDTLTKELDISGKDLLNGKTSVPMYRMQYLNGLKNDSEKLRVKLSEDFKDALKNFEGQLGAEPRELPEPLENILRDYQKTGFQWLKTLGAYRLGGILADDMGLGKTLQTIAFMLSEKESSVDKKLFMIVCPSSLTLNWRDEIAKFAPSLSAVCMNGSVAEREKLFEKLGMYDVVITSYATVIRDIDKYSGFNFSAQFLDEAQNIKNHTTQSAKAVKAVKSERRFALTGTPVENTLAELWSIFDFIMPGYLHGYSYFKKNYETPIVKGHDEKAVKSLQRMTSPFILRRLKKDVLNELPEKTETVLFAEMDDEQKKLYLANAVKAKGELETMGEAADRITILSMLTRLRQLCCDPSLVYENYRGQSAKLEQCVELVKSCVESGHKLLLFSQFTSMLDKIASRFAEDRITYYTLTGKTKPAERLKMVNAFNQNNTNVFLISLKAGGTGLNLTGADIVIHYDPWWNLSAENQASDRAYRMGQKNNVQVYKLIAKDTIEEKIRELQLSKADLMETAVGGEGDITKMSASEIADLF